MATLVYMQCNNNNKATTVYDLFIGATKLYFVPSRVRSDKGLENVKVAEFMLVYHWLSPALTCTCMYIVSDLCLL